jgi:hypothetical protein
MQINYYLNILQVVGIKHIMLIVTPKDEYPISILDDKFYKLEQSVLVDPKSYISVYEEGENEIMQYVAFRMFISRVICDQYNLHDRSVNRVKRLDINGLVSFFVVKHFYDTVPYGENNGEEAINEGERKAKEFLQDHPLDRYEYACVTLEKDSIEANVLLDLHLNNESMDFYFGRVYAG